MAEPSPKSEGMSILLEALGGRTTAIRSDRCVNPPFGCGKPCPPESFRDDLSRKEYTISGLCQDCQDDVFGDEEEQDDDYL